MYGELCWSRFNGKNPGSKKSVGVIPEIRGNRYRIDVVPYILTKGNSSSGYLYVNSNNIFGNRQSRTKTDIYRLKNIRLSENQKKIVTALKHWKNKYDVTISSLLLENLVLDSYLRASLKTYY